MKLRRWQQEAIAKAMVQYQMGINHFLALATPGAGKTIYGTKLARELFDKGLIDLVLCFSPTSMVADDFGGALQSEFNSNFDGKLGAMGHSTTYQNMRYLDDSFWSLLDSHRVFVIFDEIHHCSGKTADDANSWGESIIVKIQNRAAYTLALSGTPWRSDSTPIALARYCDESNKIICDYTYGLHNAINDAVCRMPHITALDNDDIQVTEQGEIENFSSLTTALANSSVGYQNIIENETVIIELVKRANYKLNELRVINGNAGGLIVTSSVEHALQVKALLRFSLGEGSTIVTYREELPNQIIKDYRITNTKWLISVGMVSEGTNIPRLQVCVHLTNIKTELHYRQILGRILRFTNDEDLNGYMYMLAHPLLLEYAYRVSEDIPESKAVVSFDKVSQRLKLNRLRSSEIATTDIETENTDEKKSSASTVVRFNGDSVEYDPQCPLSSSYERIVDIFGKFKGEILALGISNDLVSG